MPYPHGTTIWRERRPQVPEKGEPPQVTTKRTTKQAKPLSTAKQPKNKAAETESK